MDRPPYVLLVEDDPLVLRSLTRHLRSRGLSCTAANSVEAALRSEQNFSAAIIDINLPDGCGLSLYEQLRARGQTLVPVFFSATVDGEEIARAEGLGEFVPKSDGPLRAVDRVLATLPEVTRIEGRGTEPQGTEPRRTDPPPRSRQRASRGARTLEPTSAPEDALGDQGTDATNTVKTNTR